MEWINEKTERQNRKKNIIIKGLDVDKVREKMDLEKYIEEALKIEVKIKRVNEIKTKEKRKWMIAELDSWERKREVMEKKRNLEKGVIIEDDLTRKEREIQEKLREIAKEEKRRATIKQK